MARPLPSASVWAQRFLIDDAPSGAYRRQTHCSATAERVPHCPLSARVMGAGRRAAQILVGFAIANAGIATSPLGIPFVICGFWLMLRGIRQSQRTRQHAR